MGTMSIHRHVSMDSPNEVSIIVRNHWAEDTNKVFAGNQIHTAYAYASTLIGNAVIKKETTYLCGSCELISKQTIETIAIVRNEKDKK